jgi:hypothetical protein
MKLFQINVVFFITPVSVVHFSTEYLFFYKHIFDKEVKQRFFILERYQYSYITNGEVNMKIKTGI